MRHKHDRGTVNMSLPAYRDLHISLVKGLVSEKDELILGENFIGNWVEDAHSFLFFSRPAKETIASLLRQRPDLELIDNYHFTYEQWQGGGIKPLKIAPFLIVSPWETVQENHGALKIMLDPGVVFGNGLHPTTRHCLKALAFAAQSKPFESVLDMGTGTGILAIASACLGAETVCAVDINPLCVKTALKNVKLNDLQAQIRVVEGSAEEFMDRPADLVIANIHQEVIERILENKGLRNKQRVIISGLMRSPFREVKNRLIKKHYSVVREWDHEMTWFTCLAENKKCA